MTHNEQAEAEDRENVAIAPLAIPLITGPGAITTGIVLFSQARTPWAGVEFVLAAAAAFLVSYLLLLQSEKISKWIGVIGLKVITRVMGLLLMSLAVQFVISGLKESALLLV